MTRVSMPMDPHVTAEEEFDVAVLDEPGALIAACLYWLQAQSRQTAHPIYKHHGLSPQQASLLWQLAPGELLSMGDVADRMGCDIANITGIVDRLEKRGLIQRTIGQDRRVKLLSFTPEGLALRRELVGALHMPPEWLDGFSSEEQGQLAGLLSRAVRIAGVDPRNNLPRHPLGRAVSGER